jgi:hypothetical protein
MVILCVFPGEFTPEMQQKLRTEEEKLTKIDPWKVKTTPFQPRQYC